MTQGGAMPTVPDFAVVIGFEADTLVLRVVGELDSYTAPTLRTCALDQITAGVSDVVIDLSEMTFIDSSGLNALVRARMRVEALGGSLRLRGPSPQTRKLLEITTVDQIFPIDDAPPTDA
jgi:anti-sigma B factor antagonist